MHGDDCGDEPWASLDSLLPVVLATASSLVLGYVFGRDSARKDLVRAVRTAEPLPDLEPTELRNAALKYRPIGSPGEPYPPWVRALKGRSGVYVIRETQRDGSEVIVYVGESHTDRLYHTLTRHFQTWRRSKKFWTGQYGGQGHDPGLTYARARVTVGVRVLPPHRAIEEESRLIARLRPRDNLLGQPADELEEVIPF